MDGARRKHQKNNVFLANSSPFLLKQQGRKLIRLHYFCYTSHSAYGLFSSITYFKRELHAMMKFHPCVFFVGRVCVMRFFSSEKMILLKPNTTPARRPGHPNSTHLATPNRKKSSLQKASIFRVLLFMVQKSHSQPTENWMVLKPPVNNGTKNYHRSLNWWVDSRISGCHQQ